MQYQGAFHDKIVLNNDFPKESVFRSPLLGDTRRYKIIKEWRPKSFAPPFYKNSFSNGPVAVELVAKKLGVTNFIPASYILDKFNNVGHNYATGGAKVLGASELAPFEIPSYLASSALNSDNYNLLQQITILKQQHPKIDQKDLLIINIGSNDVKEIIEALSLFSFEQWEKFLEGRLNRVIDTLFAQVKALLEYGFNRIILGNIPDLSKTPKYGISSKSHTLAKELSFKYNQRFSWKFNFMMKNLEFKKKIKLFDMNFALEEVLKDFQLSKKNITHPAVDVNWKIDLFLKNNFTPYYLDGANETNIDEYAFFDDFHPTRVVHYKVSKKLFEVADRYWRY